MNRAPKTSISVVCAALVLVGALPVAAASPTSSSPSLTALSGARAASASGVSVWSAAAPERSLRLRPVLRRTTVAFDVAVPAAGQYMASISFSGSGSRVGNVVVEGLTVSVPAGAASLSVMRTVTDGRLTVSQAREQNTAALTGVTATAVSAGPAPTASPSPAPSTPESAPTPSASPPASARDRFLQPFASTSIWNLPIGRSATFEAASSTRTAALHGLGTAWVNEASYSHPVVRSTTGDPWASVTDTNDSSRSSSYRIPSSAPIAAGSDRHLHVVNPEGTRVNEAWAVERLTSTSYRVGRHHSVDLLGSGIGPANGTRAYGGSAIGGLIRAWEVDPAHPSYTGRIEHALAIALRNDQLLYSGGTSGYSGGYGTAKGYVWPATEQDWDSPWAYKGTIAMGTYLAIPGSVDVTSLGLTPQGLMLARAYQDYGAYVTDRSGDPILAYVEPSRAGSAFTAALLGPNWTASDLNRIRQQLRIVTNNGPTTPNAATLDGARRAPLTP